MPEKKKKKNSAIKKISFHYYSVIIPQGPKKQNDFLTFKTNITVSLFVRILHQTHYLPTRTTLSSGVFTGVLSTTHSSCRKP